MANSKSHLRISLSNHPDKFVDDSQQLLISKKVNFIFGKNGTGKTTISDQIISQFSDKYDVCLYKDFDGVVENDRLNAVALGIENAKIQKEINEIEREIDKIKKQIEPPEDPNVKNYYTKQAESNKAYTNESKCIRNFILILQKL